MAKKKLIIIVASILVVVAIGVGVGLGVGLSRQKEDELPDTTYPGTTYYDNHVKVYVGPAYSDKFLCKEFTVEDFSWDNVEKIEYICGFDRNSPVKGLLYVYLKEHGMKQVEEAIEHFSSLEFVESAIKDEKTYLI